MILSDRQLSVSRHQLNKLKEALAQTRVDGDSPEWLRYAQSQAMRSQIVDIENEIADYESLKAGELSFAENYSLSDLPRILVQARIAKGLTQTSLAAQLNMKAQQIQRYEATGYSSASLTTLAGVADALGVKVSQSFSAPSGEFRESLLTWSDITDVDWGKFPLSEMSKRRWIKGTDLEYAAREWFTASAGPTFVSALHRKRVGGAHTGNGYSLLAWQGRVLELAKVEYEQTRVAEFELTDSWIPALVALTNDERGPTKARDLLREFGILLIIESHLKGTYLDGAAMLAPFGRPVVGMTLRYDRLDNFWFVLFHELGHVFLHLFNSLGLDFFDEDIGSKGEGLEKEADEYALNSLIPDHLWQTCLSRFALTEESVILDARRLGIAPSIVAGRIRKERGDYKILNGLVGIGQVRSQFSEN